MDTKEHILDVAISAMQTEMWLSTGRPPLNISALNKWMSEKVLTKEQMIDVFNVRTPGLVASMQDIDGDFWQEFQARISFRSARGD